MSQPLRVRLIDDAHCELRCIRVTEYDLGKQTIGPTGRDGAAAHLEEHERNICRERKIFVKAALQLLESHEREYYSSVVVPVEVVDTIDFDVILSGFLHKGVKSTVPMIGASGGRSMSGGYAWKRKFVELRHREFSYYDDDGEDAPLAVSSQHSYHYPLSARSKANSKGTQQLQQGSRKVIVLKADSCACRAIALEVGEHSLYHAAAVRVAAQRQESQDQGRCAFEICVLGGQRRVFRAGSAAECARWVEAINVAMDGRGGALARAAIAASASVETDTGDGEGPLREAEGHGNCSISSSGLPRPSFSLHTALKSNEGAWRSKEGAAGPHAQSIAEYLGWQQHLHTATSEDAFRAAIRAFADTAVAVTVPVAYVKGQAADGRFGSDSNGNLAALGSAAGNGKVDGVAKSGARHAASALFKAGGWLGSVRKEGADGGGRGPTTATAKTAAAAAATSCCVEKSQMWKDLQRDEVCVNGERVCGTTGSRLAAPSECGDSPGATAGVQVGGAEAIIGLLVRHIADAADAARARLLRASVSRAARATAVEAIQEAQIVQCARNVLMLCNRTQSGGDTYYCVDSLLNGARRGAGEAQGLGSGLFILAPMSNRADPLHIVVDVVQTDRFDVDCAGQEGVGDAGVAARAETPESLSLSARVVADSPQVSTDYIDAIVASAAAQSSASPPARQHPSQDEGRRAAELGLGVAAVDEAAGRGVRRGSSRRTQLTLRLDDEASNCDNDGSPFCAIPREDLADGARHRDAAHAVTSAAAAVRLSPVPFACARDDCTVISDITFDTTAAFSQATTLAHYYHQQGKAGAGDTILGDSASPAAAQDGRANKTLFKKLFASRLTVRARQGDRAVGDAQVLPSPQTSQDPPQLPSPRFKGASTATFLSAASVDREQGRLGSRILGTGKRRPSAPAAAVPAEPAQDSAPSAQARKKDACLCVRLQVSGVSRYRVCSADPQGDPQLDNWAVVVGTFQQTFLIPACALVSVPPSVGEDPTAGSDLDALGAENGLGAVGRLARCRLALSERVVTIGAERFSEMDS